MTNARMSGLREWVAFDLETTGLSPESDAIIEIGAVRFSAREVIGEFQAFVNPYRTLPKFIGDLTGITQAEVDSAPDFSEVGPRFADFAAGATLVAHNARFDVGFLRAGGLRLDAPVCDTWELAYLVRPSARSYALGQLVRDEAPMDFRAHRASDDARAVRELFLALISDLAAVDPALLAEFRRLGERSGWEAGALLDSAEEFTRPGFATSGMRSMSGVDEQALSERLAQAPPIRAAEEAERLDVEALCEALSYGSGFSGGVPDFEERPQQIEMAEAVSEAINWGKRLMVEAGTGVGKSLAYLLPAAMYAAANDKRVVVSTNTINLQEQLMQKDLPMVKEAMRELAPELADKLRFSHLKGRSNYICYKRWRQALASPDGGPEQARLLAKTMMWMPETRLGDRAEINLGHRSAAAPWGRLSAERAHNCPDIKGPCFLKSARDKAWSSHIVVVNHALLLSDLAAGGSAIPDYDILIIDEAHHLEDVATDQLGFSVGPTAVDDIVSELSGDRGLLSQAMDAIQRLSAAESRRESVGEAVASAMVAMPSLRERMARLFREVSDAALGRRRRAGDSRFATDKRITDAERGNPAWKAVETAWEDASVLMYDLSRALSSLVTAMEGLESDAAPDYESMISDLVSVGQELDALRSQVGQCLVSPSENAVYWVSQPPRTSDIHLNAAPLRVGGLLEEKLYSRKETIVMTSATLSAGGTFDHISERLEFAGSERMALGSPFDFYEAALMYVPRHMPEPRSDAFQEQLADAVMQAAEAAGGRTMALFTSYASLRATAEAIRAPLSARGIQVLAQGADGPPATLAARFIEEPESALLGTSSFWEGVDFAGDALQALIVARLPFSVPSDPVFEARGEQYDNSFMEYAVPQAIIRFRQGFGRLIRTSRDRGIAIVLDPRITTRRYGREFINSLPKMRVTDGKGQGVGNTVKKWLEYSP